MAYYTAINAARNRPVPKEFVRRMDGRLGQHLPPFRTRALVSAHPILAVALQSVSGASPQQKRNRLEVIRGCRRHAAVRRTGTG